MASTLTRMEWDLIQYKIEQERYESSKAVSSAQEPSTVTVPLSALRQKNLPVDAPREGYIRERVAGRYIERRVTRVKTGENRIIRIKNEKLWDGEKCRLYYRKSECAVNKETGELMYPDVPRVMKDNPSRFSNPRNVYKSCDSFKWLIRANERRIRLFVTLTYAENMTDTKRLYNDYRKFWQRLCYEYNTVNGVPKEHPVLTGYLVAFEPQKRGAWHAHILLLSDKANLFIPNKKMRAIWGKGFTKTQSCQNIHDIGSYLTSYLTNLREGARTKKGARLHMYPKGFRFLRCSRDVERSKIDKWYGDRTQVSYNPTEYNLIYDYFNSYELPSGLYQCKLITCLEKKATKSGNNLEVISSAHR